ncbi:MAG: type II toxin-antitoxin system RelE/ParE family toxin [Drouetiella hepatica Uher 2000/2452]|uniref:Type II toxin-antitoxin system RelE/ParE family toxin n=1 Tax=Drouetiella hepatica Uher 2000/2452 TaxID=904376 RepID=A0A951UNE7_9CYAN|nr:type II toxin-antitoxin system RelE/ParE family toxin [Drouetiella hepatica Uher 2000/2452]
MIGNDLPSFIRDLKALKKSLIYETIRHLAFEEIPTSGIDQISDLKKIKGYDRAYRIRVSDYRISLFIEDNAITFTRVRHRREIYRYFL